MGNHKYIATPEIMWEWFEKYRNDVKGRPFIKIDYVGKDGDRVETPIERPLTIEGFKNYCAENVGIVHHYWINYENAYAEFLPIVTRIKEAIRQEQLEGGMAGMYNANLTARINGLSEKTDNKHEVEGKIKITMNLNK